MSTLQRRHGFNELHIRRLGMTTFRSRYRTSSHSHVSKEFSELTQMALKRYPNSVTQQRIPPFFLLPMESKWQQIMLAKNAEKDTELKQCVNYLSSVEPQDYPKMSTLVGSTYLWKWMKTYLATLN